MNQRIIVSVVCVLCPFMFLRAQNVAVKTNLLYDASATVNLGVEFGMAPKWTGDISGSYNAWQTGRGVWKHTFVQPEARYWFCDRFSGHFVAAHIHGGIYNIGGLRGTGKFLGTDFSRLADSRFQGWFAGMGVGYGYAFILGRHWNLDLEIGAGWSYTEYDRFQCVECGRQLDAAVPHHYFGLTKAAVNIVYLF